MGCKPQESLENTIISILYGYTVIGVTPIVPLIQIPKLPGCPAEALAIQRLSRDFLNNFQLRESLKALLSQGFLRFRTPRSGQPKKTCHVHVFCHRFEHRENGVVSFFHFSRQETRCTSKIRGLKIHHEFLRDPFSCVASKHPLPFSGWFHLLPGVGEQPISKVDGSSRAPQVSGKKSRNAATLEWKRWVFASDPAFQRKMVEWTLPTVVI